MKQNEIKLLKILILVIIVTGFYIPVSLNISDIKTVKTSITKYSDNISLMKEQKNNYTVKTEEIFIQKHDLLTLSETADVILKEMNKYKIIPERYQLKESNNNSYIDFTISCSTQSFISYITRTDNGLYPYTLSNTKISTTPGTIKATLRYTNEYCNLISSGKLLPDNKLLNKFPKTVLKETPKLVETKKEYVVKVPEEVILDGNTIFKSLGFIEENNTKYLFVKTIETGKIYKINSFDIEKDEYSYIIKIDNKKYRLNK